MDVFLKYGAKKRQASKRQMITYNCEVIAQKVHQSPALIKLFGGSASHSHPVPALDPDHRR
ncbi:MAG: hypothetical protein M0Q54_06485 [Pigmentiphaga sp.]|nr:hypothetical protein [Pigmentiphaga sp.]